MIRIGIIGSNFGTIGLLPAFRSIKGCMVVGVSHGKEWQSFLDTEALDAVAIAVTPTVQYRIAKAAIQKGLHVFAEKPLTATLAQAKDLLALAQRKKVTHAVDFTFPEIVEWKKVKELLDNKTFGKLKHVSVHWDWLSGDIKYKRKTWKTSVKDGGGALAFYFSHGLYYLEQFAGKIIDIKSQFSYAKESMNGGEVGVDLLVQFQRGITGLAHVSCNTKGIIKHELLFQCEEATIVLSGKNTITKGFTITVHKSDGSRAVVRVRKEKDKKREDERVKEVRKIATRFINACKKKTQTYPSFKDGVRVQELIELARAKKI